MEQANSQSPASRRDEDIALDLLKFVAATAGVGRAASPSTGFVGGASSKSDDQVSHLLDLYSRCLDTVQGK